MTLRNRSALVNASAPPMNVHSAAPSARSRPDHHPTRAAAAAFTGAGRELLLLDVLADEVERLGPELGRVPVVHRARGLLEPGALLRREPDDLDPGLAEGLEVLRLGLDDDLALEAARLARRVDQDRAHVRRLLVEERLVEHEHVRDEAVVGQREVLP